MAILRNLSVGTGTSTATDVLMQIGVDNVSVYSSGDNLVTIGNNFAVDADGVVKVDANRACFTRNLTFTRDFGKYKVDDTGKVVIPCKDMSVEALLLDAFSETTGITIKQPSMRITLPTSRVILEVGESKALTYNVAFIKGVYPYGYIYNGETVSGEQYMRVDPKYSVTFSGFSSTNASGTFNGVVKNEPTTLNLTATVSWDDDSAVVPLNPNSKPLPDEYIKAGSITASVPVEWKKFCYYGYTTDASKNINLNGTDAEISAQINNLLTKERTNVPTASKTINEEWLNFYYLVPERYIKEILDSNNLGVPVQTKTIKFKNSNNVEIDNYVLSYVTNIRKYTKTTLNFTWNE